MSLATAELPTDPAELRAFALACQSELKMAEISVQYKTLEIEKLKFEIAKLRRGQSSASTDVSPGRLHATPHCNHGHFSEPPVEKWDTVRLVVQKLNRPKRP
jgi:hypothetical protein